MVSFLPSASFRVTWRVFRFTFTTVAVAVSVSCPTVPDGSAGGGVAALAGATGSGRGSGFFAAQLASTPAQSAMAIVLRFMSPLLSIVRRASPSPLRKGGGSARG